MTSSTAPAPYSQYPRLPEKVQRATGHPSQRPTPSQELAIVTLQRFDPIEVIAWLQLLRSLVPGYRVREDGPQYLSQQELDAVSELMQNSNDRVSTWLARAGVQGQSKPYRAPL